MDSSLESGSNAAMGLFRSSDYRRHTIAGLLLAVFALQGAQASSCCDMDLESGSPSTGMTASEEMPCHDQNESKRASTQCADCCVSCTAMILDADAPSLSVIHHPGVAMLAHIVTTIRSDLPYRPPIHSLS